ncbi:hypothetical protein QFC20_007806 [Naganishia adeliensis]|uniref:Uncharacterized protein n=1 Tax=Naganishia adeliensis TaxID=92952 RepID=A0ACC2UVA8_9TREE|nr:hypothetical protein QFC20_007806 [Naganishia adeliensis]
MARQSEGPKPSFKAASAPSRMLWVGHKANVPMENSDVVQAKDLKPGEALVKVMYSGVCRTDLHAAKAGAGGGLGHLAVQYANLMGLRVIPIETGAVKKKLCEELGIEAWVDFKETKDIVAAIKNATEGGFGRHAAIVTSASPSGYEQALCYIRPGGTP